ATPLGRVSSKVDVWIGPRANVVGCVRRQGGPFTEGAVDAGPRRGDSEIAEQASAGVLVERDDAGTDAKRLGGRKAYAERLSTRRSEVTGDEQTCGAADPHLDRGEGEHDIPRRRRDLGEHASSVR